MDRADCWMTFSEALEQYLSARDQRAWARGNPSLRTRECETQRAEEDMKEAAEHLDALTAPIGGAA